MQFSAIVNRSIVKTYLNSAFEIDLKRKQNFSKNVLSCRLSLFKYSENEFMYLPYDSTEDINAVGEHALETFIQCFCPHEVSNMLYN